jgi:hypothetical protein
MSHKESQPVNTNPDYKDRDILLKPILIFLVGMTVVTLAVLVGMWMLFSSFERKNARDNVMSSPLVNERLLPSEPRLIPDEPMVLKEYQEKHQALLSGYASIDPVKGMVRIPVERAMELVAERGFTRWDEESVAAPAMEAETTP